ncbi:MULTISPECIES: hypothetical protein [Bacillaceae]|jgi:hypothetical protein|uniref:hypothetical protein n=1 Tax=Bacillaceae TaxID=186817 RepID=UPI0016424128|nr:MULTISPECIES: hypothetical protein [Bacillaceae]MCM3122786.1 hypothetical protein [Mesobacillus sp. MER 33]MCM3233731.1 hypothetical protein [Mesobacillus sp. MER 48]
MKKGKFLFLFGLLLYMSGIYLSTIWVVPGAAIGVTGGLLMGASTYYLAMKN